MIPGRWKLPLGLVSLWTRLSGRPEDCPSSRFVILARQRSGSTWLADLLNSHPSVVTFAELFHSDAWGNPAIGGAKEILYWNSWDALHAPATGRAERTRRYFQYLDDVVFCPRDGVEATGFKLMYNQAISAFAILAYLKLRGVRIIHLVRRNYLDGILSADSVAKRGVSLAEQGTAVKELRLDVEAHSLPRRLETRRREIEQARACFNHFGVPCLEVGYEDLVADPASVKSILEFLGVENPDVPLTSNMQKLNPKDHRDLIANYDEIASTLESTPFRDLLR